MKFGVAAVLWLMLGAAAIAEDQPSVEPAGSGQAPRPGSGEVHEGSSIADQIDLYETEDYERQEECIVLRQIKSTKAVGNQSMLFYMRDGTVYFNQFNNPCPRLGPPLVTSFESRFAGRFCKLDSISISDRVMGVMGSCNIGIFEEVTEDQAQMIQSETRSGKTVRGSVESEDAP